MPNFCVGKWTEKTVWFAVCASFGGDTHTRLCCFPLHATFTISTSLYRYMPLMWCFFSVLCFAVHCLLTLQGLVLAWSTCQPLWRLATGLTRSEHLPQGWLCAELVSVPSSLLPWVSTWFRSTSGGGLTSSSLALSSTVQSVAPSLGPWIKSNPGGRLCPWEGHLSGLWDFSGAGDSTLVF